MPASFTQKKIAPFFLRFFLLNIILCMALIIHAQKDTTTKMAADSSKKTTVTRPKEITKLDELNLPGELYARIKLMKPDQLVSYREDFTYNIKAEDKIDYTITVRLGFSQDMITGIVKWVPLYNSNDAPPEITKIKVKVQFCCTTPIDTLHKKQHCGKMSELNDFEDNEHCKGWVQKDEADADAENASSFGKPGGAGGKGKKGGVTGKTTATDEGFGKPSKDDKKKKKGKQVQESTDSTNYRPEAPEKPTKEDKKKKGKETTKKDAPTESSYGKPAPELIKENKKRKGEREKPQPTDSTNYRPEKEEMIKKDSTDGGSFGKPDSKNKKKKKG